VRPSSISGELAAFALDHRQGAVCRLDRLRAGDDDDAVVVADDPVAGAHGGLADLERHADHSHALRIARGGGDDLGEGGEAEFP